MDALFDKAALEEEQELFAVNPDRLRLGSLLLNLELNAGDHLDVNHHGGRMCFISLM